ncbi:hypothetical protein [Nocardia nova]|nr:hypothetical protein [Nocardia nova]
MIGAAVAASMGTVVSASPAHAAAKSCNLGFMPTKPTVGIGSIIGNAWAACDVAPERHELRLALQLRTRNGWQGQALISNPGIPSPRLTYAVKTKCVPGMWRVQAQAVGTLQGRPFDFVDSSMERIVTAEECARGN